MSERLTVKLYQADVFTDTVFGGYPVAVVPDADNLDAWEMQKIAREMNLSETVFVLQPTDPSADQRRRVPPRADGAGRACPADHDEPAQAGVHWDGSS